MPFRTTRTFVRPNTSTPFHVTGMMTVNNINSANEWINRGIQYGLADRREFIEVDPLTMQVRVDWDSREQRDEYLNHPTVLEYYQRINDYNLAHGITSSVTEEDI